MLRTTPPSARSEAPVIAEAPSPQRNTTRFATSSDSAKRRIREVGRMVRMNSSSTAAISVLYSAATLPRKSTAPSDLVGPGRTETRDRLGDAAGQCKLCRLGHAVMNHLGRDLQP